jgi:uncharacterized protein YcbK (DUF882 family)
MRPSRESTPPSDNLACRPALPLPEFFGRPGRLKPALGKGIGLLAHVRDVLDWCASPGHSISLRSQIIVDRRSFMKMSAFGALGVSSFSSLLSASASAAPSVSASGFAALNERSLSFHHLHTGEKLTTVYWGQGDYVPESLSQVHHILRDFRTGDVHAIDPRLLDVLCEVHTMMDTTTPFEIISGYRSPKTNATLRSHSTGVAENSLHLKGMAADVRLSNRTVAALRDAALSLKAGGVGYYPESQFVHVDVGRVRRW